jgi:predicted amidohydrolase
VVAELAQGEGVVMSQMDPERLKSVRHNLQALQHRRLDAGMTGTSGTNR